MRRALVLAAVALTLASCTRVRKIPECKDLVSTVNDGMTSIEATAKGKEDPATYRALAKSYRELSIRVSSLKIAKGSLAPQIKEYTELLRGTARACDDLSRILEHGGRPESLSHELDRLSKREKLVVARFNEYCQGPL